MKKKKKLIDEKLLEHIFTHEEIESKDVLEKEFLKYVYLSLPLYF